MKHEFAGALCAVSLLLAAPVQADDAKYASVDDIPPILHQRISEGTYLEQYIANVLGEIRNVARNPQQLDQQDIDVLRKQYLRQSFQQQFTQIIGFDRDYDSRVTAEEIEDTLTDQQRPPRGRRAEFSQIASQWMKNDLNGDGAIDLQEMRTIDGSQFGAVGPLTSKNIDTIKLSDLVIPGHEETRMQLLALDPNQDGKLTIVELEGLARKTFSTLDSNGDGQLHHYEIAAARKLQQEEIVGVRSSYLNTPLCKMPVPGAETTIGLINVYEASRLSTLSIGSMDEETGYVPVSVEPGKAKYYLVLSAFEPTIWDFKESVGQIEQVVVAAAERNGVMLAAVKGIPKEKIHFIPGQKCLPQATSNNYEDQGDLARVLGQKLGQDISLSGMIYNVHEAAISEKGIKLQAPVNTKVPPLPGYDELVWNQMLRYARGGVAEVDAENVIAASGKPKPYDVMPQFAGLAKLVGEGRVEAVDTGIDAFEIGSTDGQTDTLVVGSGVIITGSDPDREMRKVKLIDTFRIVKEIPRYPAGLNGGLSVKFIVAKGVKPPAGSPGHSCVTFEDESQPASGPDCH